MTGISRSGVLSVRELAGRCLLSLVALFTVISPYLADWNSTHIYNPHWPGHAKFHNAQTMVFGALAGLLALWFLWRPRATALHLRVGALFTALYWMTQLPAILFPGASFSDPEVGGLPPLRVLGHLTNQAELDVLLLVMIAVAYFLARAPVAPRHDPT